MLNDVKMKGREPKGLRSETAKAASGDGATRRVDGEARLCSRTNPFLGHHATLGELRMARPVRSQNPNEELF